MRERAIRLRKEGYSYGYIIKYVPVSKSTLSEWLHGVQFTPNRYTIEKIKTARIASGKFKHETRIKSFKRAEIQARKDMGNLSKRDITMLGLGMYIGEGGKTLGITRITNSDPKIINFAIKWLKISFGVTVKNLKIRLHLYPDSQKDSCIKYWSKYTGIPVNQFFKPTIDIRTDKKSSKAGKLPFGTAHLTVKGLGDKKLGVYLHRLIMAWIKRVL